MSTFARTNLAAALALAAAWLLVPGPARLAATALVVLVWSAVVTRGVLHLERRFFCRASCRAPRGVGRVVALTFDDGPDPAVTPALLDLLARRGVPAAFFAVGRRVAAAPELARRCVAEGHLVENHSHGHEPWHNFRFTRALTRELVACNRAIEAATGTRPRFHRPPFGLSNHALARAAADARLHVVGWQARGLDRRSAPPARVVARILAKLEPGGIVLLHDGGRDPARVLATVTQLLDALAARHFTVERLDRLLDAAAHWDRRAPARHVPGSSPAAVTRRRALHDPRAVPERA